MTYKNRIGYIDDEDDIVRQFQINMFDDFEVVSFKLKEDIDEMVEDIVRSNLDGIVVDFNLNSAQARIHYNGAKLINEITGMISDFPCYILTSYESEAESTLLNPDLIRDKEFVYREKKFFVDKFNRKIDSYNKRMELYRRELIELNNNYPNLNSIQEERMIELDSILERNSNGQYALPEVVKKMSNDARLDRLINLSEKLVEELRGIENE